MTPGLLVVVAEVRPGSVVGDEDDSRNYNPDQEVEEPPHARGEDLPEAGGSLSAVPDLSSVWTYGPDVVQYHCSALLLP